jgi:hypothetical protein
MATYRLKDPEKWLPGFARGKKLEVAEIRLRLKTGKKFRVRVPKGSGSGGHEFSTSDPRTIRLLDADPRFERVA